MEKRGRDEEYTDRMVTTPSRISIRKQRMF